MTLTLTASPKAPTTAPLPEMVMVMVNGHGPRPLTPTTTPKAPTTAPLPEMVMVMVNGHGPRP